MWKNMWKAFNKALLLCILLWIKDRADVSILNRALTIVLVQRL